MGALSAIYDPRETIQNTQPDAIDAEFEDVQTEAMKLLTKGDDNGQGQQNGIGDQSAQENGDGPNACDEKGRQSPVHEKRRQDA